MASSASNFVEADTGYWNPSRKIRIVGKIRGFTDLEAQSSDGFSEPWITVRKTNGELSESVTLSFGDQPASRKDSYEIDYCYAQDEGNGLIFSREVKPMISRVLNGHAASVIGYGARGSGKTYTIQGSDEKPGLAALAMDELLQMAREIGKSVAISLYEVYQDHIYDLSDPSWPQVLVLEDALGKIKLKGLSQVPVNSMSDFYKLYYNGCGLRKPAQKMTNVLPCRSHKGLMIHVSSQDSESNLVGKMNFVDLTGYEDYRRKGADGPNLIENTKINKSLYALQNVVYALSINESHVPYRESKLTRILQDSFGGMNQILMVTCLNPSFCQDSLCSISIASRSYQGALINSTKKIKSSAKRPMVSALKQGKPSVSSAVKRQTSSQMHFSDKKANSTASKVKGRVLFKETKDSTSSEKNSLQPNFPSSIPSVIEPSFQEEVVSNVSLATVPLDVEISSTIAMPDTVPDASKKEKMQEISSSIVQPDTVPAASEEKVFSSFHNNDKHPEVTDGNSSIPSASVEEGCSVIEEKEKESLSASTNGSPPLSVRLQALSNHLKSLYFSTSEYIKTPLNDISNAAHVSSTLVEPKTPIIKKNVEGNEKREVTGVSGPWETLHGHSSRMKKSLVEETLKFLNSANKEELKGLKGIGEKRSGYILELRQDSPEPFKSLDDLKGIGLSQKQIKGLMRKVVEDAVN